jgi:single-strand DNA-binding protein
MASKSWNKVELMGNLTRDPELRYTPNGAAVCTFGIATNRSFLVDGERREDVDFHKVVAWNKLAELCTQLLKKGTRVFVSGRLQYREWAGQDGIKRRDAEISVDDMIVITPKGGSITASASDDLSTDSLVEAATQPQVEKAEEESAKEEQEEPKGSKSAAKEEKLSPDEDLPF